MATFRCKRSGNIVHFINPDDIAGLRKHEGYTEVIPNESKQETSTREEIAKETHAHANEEVLVLKRRGRPKKVATM